MSRTAFRAPGQSGFTLLELLVVIAVLGTLSGVAVVAVGRLTDSASAAACRTDAKVLADAQEAMRVMEGAYGDEASLVSAGYLSGPSTMHDIVLLGDSFELVPVGDCATDDSVLAEAGPDRDATDGPSTPSDGWGSNGEPTEEEQARRAAEAAEAAAADQARRVEAERNELDQPRAGEGPGSSGTCRDGQIDLNRASRDEMTKVVHLTPGRADQIIKERPLSSLEDLLWVGGLNDARVKAILSEGLACV